jgi:hypothetical protein
VQAILSDICIEAQVRIFVGVLSGPPWDELWKSLNLSCYAFRDVHLAPDTADSAVWDFCQRKRLFEIEMFRGTGRLWLP